MWPYISVVSPSNAPASARPALITEIVIVTRWLLLFVCYSIALDSTDISTLDKGKAPASTNGVEAYNKEILGDEIRRLIIVNV